MTFEANRSDQFAEKLQPVEEVQSPPIEVSRADLSRVDDQITADLATRFQQIDKPLIINCSSCGAPSPLSARNCAYCNNGLADEKATLLQQLRAAGVQPSELLVITDADLAPEEPLLVITEADIEAAAEPQIRITAADLDEAFDEASQAVVIGHAEINQANQELLDRFITAMTGSQREILRKIISLDPEVVATCVRIAGHGDFSRESLDNLISPADLVGRERAMYDQILSGNVGLMVRVAQGADSVLNTPIWRKIIDYATSDRPADAKVGMIRQALSGMFARMLAVK